MVFTDGGTSLEFILGVKVLVHAVFGGIGSRSGYVEATSSETVIGLLNSVVLGIADTRICNFSADNISVRVLSGSREFLTFTESKVIHVQLLPHRVTSS